MDGSERPWGTNLTLREGAGGCHRVRGQDYCSLMGSHLGGQEDTCPSFFFFFGPSLTSCEGLRLALSLACSIPETPTDP